MVSLALDNGKVLEISIRTSSRARRLRLVSGIRGVEAVVPTNYDQSMLQEFLDQKRGWIIKTAKYYDRLRPRAGHTEFDVIYYLGRKYRVKLVKDRISSAIVSESLGTATFHVTDMRRYKQEIERWYKEEAAKIIAGRLPVLSAKLGLAYNKFTVKRHRSRWASCSRKKNLNFSLLLAAAPMEVIDYVIVHELCHTVEMNHSDRFWKLVESADHAYKEHKKWLDDHSPVIGVQSL